MCWTQKPANYRKRLDTGNTRKLPQTHKNINQKRLQQKRTPERLAIPRLQVVKSIDFKTNRGNKIQIIRTARFCLGACLITPFAYKVTAGRFLSESKRTQDLCHLQELKGANQLLGQLTADSSAQNGIPTPGKSTKPLASGARCNTASCEI